MVFGVLFGGSDEGEDDGDPGLRDIFWVELEMSWYCDEVEGWEHIALWLLGHPEAQWEDPNDDREVAERIVSLDHACDYWKTKGNREMVSLNEGDPEAVERFQAYVEGIGVDKIRSEIDQVESELPRLRADRERLRQLDKILGE